MANNLPQAQISSQLSDASVEAKVHMVSAMIQDGLDAYSTFLQHIGPWLNGNLTPQEFAGIDTPSVCALQFHAFHYQSMLNIVLSSGEARIADELTHGGNGLEVLLTLETPLHVHLLEKWICSDAFLSLLLRQCRTEENWEETVQLLISLPDRVANKFQNRAPLVLMPQQYCHIIGFQIMRSLAALQIAVRNGVDCSPRPLGFLIGKLCMGLDGNHLLRPIMPYLSAFTDNYIGKKIVQRMLQNVPRRAVLRVAVPLLNNSDDPFPVDVDGSWHHVLTHKLLFDRVGTNRVLRNLLKILSDTDRASLVLTLLDVWGNKISIKHTSLEQHLYITKAILVCSQDRNDSITLKLLSGVPLHLETGSEDMAAIGMFTAEMLSEVKFGDTFNRQSSVIEELAVFMEYFNAEIVSERKDWEDVITKSIHKLLEESVSLPQTWKRAKSISGTEEVQMDIPQHPEEPLDSDDDLEPFDMSDDIPQSESQPTYLRDLLDGLLEAEKSDQFQACLESASSLIRQKLPDDDVELAVELATVLLHLDNKFSTPQFSELRAESILAVILAFPKHIAEFLTKEFRSSQYSVAQRCDILDTISAAAKELSSVPQSVEPESRSARNTRYFHKPRQLAEKCNRFGEVAGSFYYPLLAYCDANLTTDTVLLTRYIHTLGTIVTCSVNTPGVIRMGRGLLDALWHFRFHSDGVVRQAVLVALRAVVSSVPAFVLLGEWHRDMTEFGSWLQDVVENDPLEKCQHLAMNIVLFISQTVHENSSSLE